MRALHLCPLKKDGYKNGSQSQTYPKSNDLDGYQRIHLAQCHVYFKNN